MERIRHIKETQNKKLLYTQTHPGETGPIRDVIEQHDKYDLGSETRREQMAVRETLNSVDEDTLKDIFLEYFRRSGSDENTMNWVPLNEVRILYDSPDEEGQSNLRYGFYSIASGVCLISHNLWDDPEQTLWTLIHEQCHSVSQDRLRSYAISNSEGDRVREMDRVKSGVSRKTWVKENNEEEENVYDKDINEGITEILTERIFREYKRRAGVGRYSKHPTRPDQSISNAEKKAAEIKFGPYERNWQNAKLYIGIVSAVTNIPEDVVENAVIRTYFRNGTIFPGLVDDEVREILFGIHPQLEYVLLSIAASKKETGLTLSRYVDYLSESDLPEGIKQKIVDALNKIREEWGEAYKIAPHVI